MKTFGIIYNPEKLNIVPVVDTISDWLKNNDKTVFIASVGPKASFAADCPEFGIVKDCDCILVLGGDGTLLHVARCLSAFGTPLCGINLGQLGFLTEVELPDLIPSLEKLVHGEYTIEERMLIQATVNRSGKEHAKFLCLNDAVITKGAFSRIIHLKASVNKEFIDMFPADGIIISTPTGSTAYSLSAGGPIVAPDLELMILTPISPHSLASRPIVVNKDSEVKVEIQSTLAEVMLTIDGQAGFQLQPFDEVVVQKADFNARFVKLQQRSFYEILRKKIKEGRNTNV